MSDRPPRANRMMWLIIFIILAASATGWFRLRVDSSLNPLLPETSDARQTLQFLSDSSFASKAILWFRCTPSGTPAQLFAAADAIQKRLDPALIKRIISPPTESAALPEIFAMLDHAGELLNAQDLADLQSLMTPKALSQRMRDIYMQMVHPEGSFALQIIRRDPLGVNTRILTRLSDLSKGLGYKVVIQDGRFVHPDGRQLMLILETSSSATGLASSERLAAHLEALAATPPPGVTITPICPQIHTQQNHQSMQRDMQFASIIDTIAFVLLFLVVGRDWRVGAVFFLPLVTIGLTIGLCALIYPNLSMVVIGMAIPMAGSAVDYGIFVYTALWLGSNPTLDVRRIRRPLIISHLTTLGVFFAFLFSHIPAYRQLGCLTSISLVLSLLGALFVLPKMMLKGGKPIKLWTGIPLTRWGKMMQPALILGGILFIIATFFALKIGFDSDITQLDGITPEVRKNEADFQHTWGQSDTELAILVASAPTREAAEELNDKLTQIVSPKLPDGQLVSLSNFWPSETTRRANEARWQAFWTPDRVASFRAALLAAGKPYDFSAAAFDPFFDSLTHPPQGEASRTIISTIEEQFVSRASNGNAGVSPAGPSWQILNYFTDTDANITTARALIKDIPGAQVVSRRALGQAFAESAVSETHILISIAVAFIVVSLLVLTRSLTKSAIIMLPVLCGIVLMLAVMVLLHESISAISIVAAILVLALGSDYGIFAVYAWDNKETTFGQGMAAVHLSSITTVIGTGALLFAHHPAMFLCGVTLTSGLLGGYLTAFFLVPAVCFLVKIKSSTT